MNKITEKFMKHCWNYADTKHNHPWDGFFGMEEDDWEKYGVVMTDTPEQVFVKVQAGIEKDFKEGRFDN